MSTVIFSTKEDDWAREPMRVLSITCPVHGDVTEDEDVGVKNENGLWPIYATIELLRSGAVHHLPDDGRQCLAQLLWELGPQESAVRKGDA